MRDETLARGLDAKLFRGMGMKINDKFQSITVVINDNYNSVYEDSSFIYFGDFHEGRALKAASYVQGKRWLNVMGCCLR